jgi:hypothetical protein
VASSRLKRNQRKRAPRNSVKNLVSSLEVFREYPSGTGHAGLRAGNNELFNGLNRSAPESELTLPAWAEGAARCLNAYISRDYSRCATYGQEALSHQFLPTVGLVSILALRRLRRPQKADALGRSLLRLGFGPGGMFLFFMMLLDAAIEPEEFLRERFFGGYQVKVTKELRCQVYFYWGAKLVTEESFSDAIRPLLLSVGTECDALERRLAEADLEVAIARGASRRSK